MKRYFTVLVLGFACAFLSWKMPLSAQAVACSSQTECSAQASSAIISDNEVGYSNLSGLWMFDKISGKSYSLGSPGSGLPATANYLALNPWASKPSLSTLSASITWLPSENTTYTLASLPAIKPNTGFTILLVYQNQWNTANSNGIAASIGNSDRNGVLLSMGRSGNQWTFGRRLNGTTTTQTGSNFWQTPWDPRSTVAGAFEWVYYTFTPDGKVRIDKFMPYVYFGVLTGYDWQESTLDGGYPFQGFPTGGTPTTNPSSVSFYPPGDLISGSALDYKGTQSYISPTVSVPGFNREAAFNIALTTDQMVAYQKTIADSYWLSWGSSYPCNTGYWMNKSNPSVYTPCGTAGGGNPPAGNAGGGVMTTPSEVVLSPQNLSVTALSTTSVSLTWNASIDPKNAAQVDAAVTTYSIFGGPATVTVNAVTACSAGKCAATVSGLTAGQEYSFYVTGSSAQATSASSDVFRISPTIIVVGPNTQYPTLTAALAALPATGGTIEISPGTYHEKLVIAQSNVILIGTGSNASQVVITYNDSVANGLDAGGLPIPRINPATGKAFSTSGTYTMKVTGNNFYATNLTIANTADYETPNYENNGQAVALMTTGDRSVFRAVMLEGGQDTLYSNGAAKRSYFDNCYIDGYVDYIFGNGKTVFDGSILKTKIHSSLNGEATITAQNRATATEDDGYVITNSTLLFDDPYMNNVWLGRPWGAYSTTYYLNTKMGPQVVNAGWIEFIPLPVSQGGTNNLPTSTYREYGTLYPGTTANTWVPFSLSVRESTSPQSNVALTTAQVAALSPSVYLKGTDNWNPTTVTFGGNTTQTLPIPTIANGVPGKPTIVSTIAGNGNVQISWTGSPANPVETGYRITAVQNGKTYGPMDFPPYASSGYISGLTNGAAATVTLVEGNSHGWGAGSQTSATPVSHDPSAPVVSSIAVTNSTATVYFTVADQGISPVWNGVNSHGVYYGLYSSLENYYANVPIPGTANGEGSTTPITNLTFNTLTANTTYYVALRVYNGWNSPTVILPFTTAK